MFPYKHHIENLIDRFREGQVVLKVDDKVVGCALSIIINGDDFEVAHSYKEITGNYSFQTHDPDGDLLYGIEIFIKPEFRGLRLGRRLYDYRKELCEKLNLKGIALGEAIKDVGDYVRTLDLPPGYRHEFIGRAKLLSESNTNFVIAFLLSFLFMYMVLAAQFESLVHPITILLALPLTLPFAFLSLFLLRTNFDIYAVFGLFMLFGIVKKNGILQIDYTNVLRARGMEVNAAILEANKTRLRPILMTTLMLIAAMVPIALGQGPGAGARASMAKVIIGGQGLSLLLTLLVTPVAYSLWEDFTRYWSRYWSWVGRWRSQAAAHFIIL